MTPQNTLKNKEKNSSSFLCQNRVSKIALFFFCFFFMQKVTSSDQKYRSQRKEKILFKLMKKISKFFRGGGLGTS